MEDYDLRERPSDSPQSLTTDHELSTFDCGVPALNRWIRRKALANQVSGASRTFVYVDETGRVVGFYALAMGAVERSMVDDDTGQDMPDPIPIALLGRLAVDQTQQGKGLGSDLLRDALLRILRTAEDIGVRAVLVHAKNESAKAFYTRWGFRASPVDSLMLMITIAELKSSLGL